MKKGVHNEGPKKKTSQGMSPRTKVGQKGSKTYKKRYRGQGR